jgi:hypothetical protein
MICERASLSTKTALVFKHYLYTFGGNIFLCSEECNTGNPVMSMSCTRRRAGTNCHHSRKVRKMLNGKGGWLAGMALVLLGVQLAIGDQQYRTGEDGIYNPRDRNSIVTLADPGDQLSRAAVSVKSCHASPSPPLVLPISPPTRHHACVRAGGSCCC